MFEDDGKFNDWFSNKFKENAVMFAESKDDEFEEFCFNRYSQDPYDPDEAYDRMKEDEYLRKNGEL